MNVKISFNDAELINGFFYAASNLNNEFYKFDENGAEVLFQFEKEPAVRDLFMQTVCVGNRIILTPSSAGKIYVYDFISNDLKGIEFDNRKISNGKFHGCVLCGSNVYFMPFRYPAIISLDLYDYSIEYIVVPCHVLNEGVIQQEPQFVYGYFGENNLNIYRLFSNCLFCMDLNNREIRNRRLPIGDDRIWGYIRRDDYEYVVSENGIFVLKNEVVIFHDNGIKYTDENYLFSACGDENRIIFVPFRRYCPTPLLIIERIDDEHITVKTVSIKTATTFHCFKRYGDRLYLLTNYTHTFIEYDVARDTYRVIISGFSDGIVQESKLFQLREWLSLQLI